MNHATALLSTPPSGRSIVEVLILFVLAALGATGFWLTFFSVEPATQLHVEIDRRDAWRIADRHLVETGYALDEYEHENAAFVPTNSLIAFFRLHDISDARSRGPFLQHLPLGFWSLVFRNPENGDRFTFKIDPRGRIFESLRTPPAGISIGRLTQSEAIGAAKQALERRFEVDWSRYQISEARTAQADARTDHFFTWERSPAPLDGVRLTVSATVQGENVGGWNSSIELPDEFSLEYSARSRASDLFEFVRFLVAAVAWILALFVFALRFRAHEIGLRNGVVVALTLVGLLAVYYGNASPSLRQTAGFADAQVQPLVVYFVMAVNILFTGLGVFVVWITGESTSRDVWPEKLHVPDAIFAGKFDFAALGQSVVRAFPLALTQLGMFYTVAYLLASSGDAWPIVGETSTNTLASFTPFGSSETISLAGAVLTTTYAFLFSLSVLKRRTGRTWVAVLITLVLFGAFFSDASTLLDSWYTSVAGIASGVVAYIFFLRYGLMTVFVGTFVANAIPIATVLVSQPADPYRLAGAVTLALLAILLTGGVVLIARGRTVDPHDIQPRYVRYISERERLKLELDVARRAQLRMLPRTIPDTAGLDVAAFSEPAREVGGDYFDFFRLGAGRLGVAIGDVSGKGMPAALYMTMLKGFLQSQANTGASPREILCSTNRYFHASAEAQTFITLLFCVFDLHGSSVSVARAGHYPLLLQRRGEADSQCLQPPGIGIGLEEGEIFDRVIVEESVGVQAGDVLAMYTDGLVEARNKASEEFGQVRIRDVLRRSHQNSAEEILSAIRRSYEEFRGSTEAVDDFSCVVVRVR